MAVGRLGYELNTQKNENIILHFTTENRTYSFRTPKIPLTVTFFSLPLSLLFSVAIRVYVEQQ